MRILMLSNLCPPYQIGGYELACFNVAAGLQELGHDVRLATTRSHIPAPPDPAFVDRCFGLHWFLPVIPPNEGAQRYALFHATVSDYDNTSVLLRQLRDFAPDVVYAWYLFGIGGLALFDLLNLAGVPWVMHLMDDMPAQLFAVAPPHVRSVFGGPASDLFAPGRAIAMSQSLLDAIEAKNRLVFERTDIVPGWVDLRRVPERGAYPGAPVRFVTAGQVEAHKGIGLMIEAAARLRQEGVPDFAIDVYGRGDIPRFLDMAQRFGVHDIVQFHGARSQAELLTLYPRYHAFLFPTEEREPFGFAPIEAAACGCIPIVTRQCGAAERLVDAAHCFKIDLTVEDLAGAMRTIAEGRADLPAMARRSADMVRRDLSFERAQTRIEAILRQEARGWDRTTLDEARLPLLLYAKHHLAMSMMFG